MKVKFRPVGISKSEGKIFWMSEEHTDRCKLLGLNTQHSRLGDIGQLMSISFSLSPFLFLPVCLSLSLYLSLCVCAFAYVKASRNSWVALTFNNLILHSGRFQTFAFIHYTTCGLSWLSFLWITCLVIDLLVQRRNICEIQISLFYFHVVLPLAMNETA